MRLSRFLFNNNMMREQEEQEEQRLTSKNNKMYEMLENDTIEIEGKTLYRIRSLIDAKVKNKFVEFNIKKGQLGGYIESEKNLDYLFSKNSPYNYFSWIDERACVLGEIEIKGNTLITGDAKIGLDKGIGPIIESYINGIKNIVIKGKCGIIETSIIGSNILIENNCDFFQTFITSRGYSSIKLNNVSLFGNWGKNANIYIMQKSDKLLELKDIKIKPYTKEIIFNKDDNNNIENFYQLTINKFCVFVVFANAMVFNVLNNSAFFSSLKNFEHNEYNEIGSIKDFLKMMVGFSIEEEISLLELGLKYNDLIYYCIEVNNINETENLLNDSNLSKFLLNDELLSLMQKFDIEQNIIKESKLLIDNKYMEKCEIELGKIIKKFNE